jgi:hypothetical protein
MGNGCCSGDTSDDMGAFTFTKGERKKLLSNMNMMHEDSSISENAPKSSVASLANQMN